MRRLWRTLLVSSPALLLGACAAPHATGPSPLVAATRGERIVHIALAQLGRPYRYGGDTPRRGFDCSGLVYYAATRAGLRDVPRTVREQYRDIRRVSRATLHPGDILFFDLRHSRPTHDGIYIGSGDFVHAPRSGERVTVASLDDPFWRRHFFAAGRLR